MENNEKKLMVGVSIILCTIILILGVTTAYFTKTISKDIDTIVSNDQELLEYKDDLNYYMRQELIPTTKENAIIAYNREGDNKCLDINNYSACSIYRFSIKNISDMTQSLLMTLNPTANSYTNLKFMLYEIKEEGNVLIKDTTSLVKDNYEPIELHKSYELNDNKKRKFDLVFYIEEKNADQTMEDGGKRFGAGVRINSITTGKHIVKNFGSSCWELDANNRQKLVKFNGINMDTGEIDDMCTGYVSQDEFGYYSVNIPSNVGGQDVTIIGNNLFNAIGDVGEDGPILNKYGYIKEIKIQDGIEEIEDGDIELFNSAFIAIGFGIEDENYNLNVKLPNTLIKTGSFAFYVTQLKQINLPNGVKTISDYSFPGTILTSVIIPKSVETIGDGAFAGITDLATLMFVGAEDGTSKLKTIGVEAFSSTGLTSLIFPSSLEIIGESAFSSNENLTSLIFAGAEDGTSKLKNIKYGAFNYCDLHSLIIPSSVEEISGKAFYDNENLTKVTFEGALTGDSKLHTLGEGAFDDCDLTYETEDNPLILPPTIINMNKPFDLYGIIVGNDNRKLKYIFFAGDTTGFPSSWKAGATVITKFPNDSHLNIVR